MALLADRLIETATDKRWPPSFRRGFEYVAGQIKSAQRFVVSDDVRGAIRTLLSSRPSTLVEAAKYARLPFDRCWFEWTPSGTMDLAPNQVEVKRCGALLERFGPHGYTLYTAWEYDRSSVQRDKERFPKIATLEFPLFGISALVGGWDLSSMDDPPVMLKNPEWMRKPANTVENLVKLRDDQKNGIGHALRHPGELEALAKLERRSVFRIFHEAGGAERIEAQDKYTGNLVSVIRDVEDEMGHLFATLILMNARNCVDIAKAEPPAKLNKARRKAGKPELLPYSTVRIELTQSQERAVQGGLISREEARRHLVRGHFKVRSSGVFWWGDFWRGNAIKGVVERKAHLIEAGTP